MQFGDMRGFWGIWHAGLSQLRKKTGVIPAGLGEGTANTALVYHANKLMSLHEGDLPYAVRRLAVNKLHRWPHNLLQGLGRWCSCVIPVRLAHRSTCSWVVSGAMAAVQSSPCTLSCALR